MSKASLAPSPPNGKQISHLPRRSSSHSSAQRQVCAIYSLPRWSVEGKCTTIRCFSAWLPPSYPLHVDAAGFPPILHLHFCLILFPSTHPTLLLLYSLSSASATFLTYCCISLPHFCYFLSSCIGH